jgi:hypothetical protein
MRDPWYLDRQDEKDVEAVVKLAEKITEQVFETVGGRMRWEGEWTKERFERFRDTVERLRAKWLSGKELKNNPIG